MDSAIKDLAAVLHQSGSTREAVDFLMKHRDIYRGDLEKYDNLIQNLSKQVLEIRCRLPPPQEKTSSDTFYC